MGCCASKSTDKSAKTEVLTPNKQQSFIDCSAYPGLLSTADVQVQGCAAAWPVGGASKMFTTLQTAPHSVFCALWEAHQGLEAAVHANSHCYEAFTKSLAANNNIVEDALKDMFVELDRTFFASGVETKAKAAAGATGLVVYVDFRINVTFVGRLGPCACIVGQTIGSFNQSNVECQVIAQEDPRLYDKLYSRRGTEDGSDNADHPDGVAPQQPTAGKALASRAAAYAVPDHSAALPKRAIGFGYGKMAQLTEVYNQGRATRMPTPSRHDPYVTAAAHVSSYAMSPKDSHLVLTTEDLLSLVTAHEGTLLASDFSPAQMRTIQNKTLGVAAVTAMMPQGGDEHSGAVVGGSSVRREMNVASLIVRHALEKAMQRHNRKLPGSSTKVGWHDIYMMQLPKMEAGGKGKKSSKSSHAVSPADEFRVNKSLAALVIQLDWTRGSGNSMLLPVSSLRFQNAWARYRWLLLINYARFLIQRRRHILDKWNKVHKDLVKKAERDARDAEVAMFRTLDKVVQVSKTGQISTLAGAPVTPPRRPLGQANTNARVGHTPTRTLSNYNNPASPPRKPAAPATTPTKRISASQVSAMTPSTTPKRRTTTLTPTKTSTNSSVQRAKQQRLNTTPVKDPKSYDLRGGSRTPSRTPSEGNSPECSSGEVSPVATALVF